MKELNDFGPSFCEGPDDDPFQFLPITDLGIDEEAVGHLPRRARQLRDRSWKNQQARASSSEPSSFEVEMAVDDCEEGPSSRKRRRA